MIRLMLGDCRDSLRSLNGASIQTVVTSPPYYGLRDYGLPPLVWGGDPEHAHSWGDSELRQFTAPPGTPKQASNAGALAVVGRSSCCSCGAWLGSHGLEPTPELYLQHAIEIFAEVRRVLRDDGTLWLNLGDSYAGSGKGPSNSLQPEASQSTTWPSSFPQGWRGGPRGRDRIGQREGAVAGYKPKDLMLLPFRVALALQSNGWFLRSTIPWLKRNSMPESVTDRPSTSVEYVFLFAKNSRYFWDPDAVRLPALNPYSESEYADRLAAQTGKSWSSGGIERYARSEKHDGGRSHPNGRNRRNSDWFFESWQGLLLDSDDTPQALLVNPQPFSGAHFATFPPKLVEPMLKASTRPGDTVLDPFAGAGTVGLVADRLQRDAVLMDLKPDYHLMSQHRVMQDAPMFVQLDGMFDSPHAVDLPRAIS